jgi:hypothetical protein
MNVRAWIASITGATVVAALSVVTVAVPAADAAPPVEVPAGTITLSTGAVDNLVYDKGTASAADDVVQAIGTKPGTNCTLDPTTGPLATWSATGGVPSFRSDSIGTSATSLAILACAQINKSFGQSLTLKLDRTPGGVYSTPFGLAFANAASLDVEIKGDDALVRADTYLDGVLSGTFYLFNDEDSYRKPTVANLTVCNSDQYSYSYDRGLKDNCRWNLSGVRFDKLTITPQRGSVSLEGGGDYGTAAAANRTTISLAALADGTVDCGVSAGSATSEGSVSSVTIDRIDNGDPADSCAPLPFTLRTDGGSAQFIKPGNTQTSAQFTVSLTRTFPANIGIPPLLVDWEDGTPEYEVPWCAPGLRNADGTFNYAVLQDSPSTYDASETLGIQYACSFGMDPTYDNGTGKLTVVDSVYFTGDIKLRPGA